MDILYNQGELRFIRVRNCHLCSIWFMHSHHCLTVAVLSRSHCIALCVQIVSTFPCWWFQSQQQGDCVCLPQLQMFIAQLKTIAQCLDVSAPAGRQVAVLCSLLMSRVYCSAGCSSCDLVPGRRWSYWRRSCRRCRRSDDK